MSATCTRPPSTPAAHTRSGRAERDAELLRWLSCATAVATALVVGRSWAPNAAAGTARALSALVALALVVRLAPPFLRRGRPAPTLLASAVGGLSGLLTLPLWGAGLLRVGALLGLSPLEPLDAAPDAGTVLAIGLLAPAFEELLYRGWLLSTLAPRTGWPTAVLVSSLAFALPHADAWSRLTAFALGVTLALARRFGAGLGTCVGTHAGLNLAYLLREPLAWAHHAPALPAAGGALWLVWIAFERRDQSRNARASRRLRGSSVSGSRSR